MTTISDYAQASGPTHTRRVPWLVRCLGVRWMDDSRSWRMTWGELSLGRGGFALGLHLFGDPSHYSLGLRAFWVTAFIQLPLLARWARDPHEIMETWGVAYHPGPDDGYLRLCWGRHAKHLQMPWRDWRHVSHEVRRSDGTWAPFVGSWERDKEPDGRHDEIYPYHYLLRSGEVQERTATIHVERRTQRLRWLRRTSWGQRVWHSIDVTFSGEVGERSGSWKGGTIGCGYELRPDETPRECLRRMEAERKF